MAITYYNQFDNESIDKIPDPKKKYYLNESEVATGFTYLFKLLWLIEKMPELTDKLLLHKKDINVKIGKWSALHFVCYNYMSDKLPEVVRLLINMGGKFYIQRQI